jgi:hypothetical protein
MAAGGTSGEIKIIKAICLTWKVDRRRQVIYARAALSQSERVAAAHGLIRR